MFLLYKKSSYIYSFLLTVFILFFYPLDEELSQDIFWYNYLPNCPCQNPDKKLININDGWAKDKGNISKYHRGATECFRSYPSIKTPEGESGQQCCYDRNNNLITEGSGAGTPDKISTCSGEDDRGFMNTKFFSLLGHYRKDVKPWNDMGGEINGWMKYNLLWKPNNGYNCKSNGVAK